MNTTMAFMSNVTSHLYFFMDFNRPNLKSLLNSNERFQCGKLKFRLLFGRDFPKFTVLLQYLVFKLKNKNAENAELFILFSERRTAVEIRIKY